VAIRWVKSLNIGGAYGQLGLRLDSRSSILGRKNYDPMWQPNSLVARISGLGGLAVLISFGLALAALFKNEPPLLAYLLCFSVYLVSFYIFDNYVP
jgi:hypothetical protein